MTDLTVRPMTSAEFVEWQDAAVEEYAKDVANARGVPLETGREIAEESHRRLLPDGLGTAGVHIVIGEDADGARVGILWVGPNPDGVGPAWIFDIEVTEARRGEGWGRALMAEAERIAVEDGHSELGLNVFGYNAVARGLYESLGYEATSIQMRKPLRSNPL
jgi:ribosomal protein S18 acetylase RimI-like enzyme